MIDALFQQPEYVAAKRLMSATTMERTAIASNLANIETPNYHRVQVNPGFGSQLQEAMKSNDVSQIQDLTPQLVEDPNDVSSRMDGNNVVLEHELMNLMKTGVDHTLETQLVTGNLLQLRLAITGRA